MRTERFKELHPVRLSDEDRRIRYQQSGRQVLAIERQEQKIEDEADAWKERKKALATELETMQTVARKAAKAAETGEEERWVECEEKLVGAMVLTVRCDNGETVSSRNASKDELHGNDKPKTPGAKLAPPTVEEKSAKIDRLVLDRCAKQFAESAVIKAVLKDAPEATSAEVKARITLLVEAGRLVEGDGKLLAVHPTATDDGIVDDSYGRDGAPTH